MTVPSTATSSASTSAFPPTPPAESVDTYNDNDSAGSQNHQHLSSFTVQADKMSSSNTNDHVRGIFVEASNPITPSTARQDPTKTTTTTTTTTIRQKHIWVITGPAGCGKTSVAENLQAEFGFPYLEGDSFHTPENVAKMGHGQPLTDADRWDWLIRLREEALAVLHGSRSTSSQSARSPSPKPTSTPTGVFVTCSALKRKYRDVLRIAALEGVSSEDNTAEPADERDRQSTPQDLSPSVAVHFIFLSVSEEVLLQRVRGRQGHYMKEDMVRSQLQSLETPRVEEERDVYAVEAGADPATVSSAAAEAVRKCLSACY